MNAEGGKARTEGTVVTESLNTVPQCLESLKSKTASEHPISSSCSSSSLSSNSNSIFRAGGEDFGWRLSQSDFRHHPAFLGRILIDRGRGRVRGRSFSTRKTPSYSCYNNAMECAFDHEKLDVYQIELQFIAWLTDFYILRALCS
jgi:hypothetical protein